MKRLLPNRSAKTLVSHLDHPLGEIRVQRKAIRHLYLRLDPGDGALRVNAPRRTSDRAIRAFVTARADWIDRQRHRLAQRPPMVTGDRLPDQLHLLGEAHALIHEATDGTRGGTVTRGDGTIRIRCAYTDKARDLLRRDCRRRLQTLLDTRVPQWADHMGLPRPETRIRRMRSRWGTCNIGACRIWLNLELVRMPVGAIDLVIVHELAHLIERGHNRRFYAVMDRAYPDWRHWEASLSEYGIIGL
ncbi:MULTISPECIES: SprT family zinc-dependent metalloprotease [unclassified Guyparkeria]|uniref:M48 family metallopeptidase n=1 Tax=unclassified Guyparkeria TaxID=2626246 RepID=UPI0007334148|nr:MULTISPECIES: SprT family zinc-dependent metalloprotease [unclassified Guyparkeria]KTG15937.1 hypothetical protein AUR63_05640 [Guyparkeria sp. XI15]OAE84692.1 hypothetical protein AWR35_05650 [Guyparkeria sp. WRN-7]